MRWDIWSNPSVCNYNNFNANPTMTQLLQKAYMCSPSDWKNMEMTALYFCTGGSSGAAIEHVMGGGKNTNSACCHCQATNYHFKWHVVSGGFRLERNIDHGGGSSPVGYTSAYTFTSLYFGSVLLLLCRYWTLTLLSRIYILVKIVTHSHIAAEFMMIYSE